MNNLPFSCLLNLSIRGVCITITLAPINYSRMHEQYGKMSRDILALAYGTDASYSAAICLEGRISGPPE